MANNFQSFFGDENLNNLDLRIQGIVDALPPNATKQNSDNISGEFIDTFIDNNETSEVKRILESATVSKMRIDRYGVYDEAYKYVPVIKRMMKVYIASVLQKNPITGQCIIIKKSDKTTKDSPEDDANSEKALKLAKTTIEHFNMTNKLKRKILPTTLLYGDSFIEIINVNDESKKENPAVNSTMDQMPIFENLTSQVNQLNNGFSKKDTRRYEHIDALLEQTAKLFVDYDETLCISEEDIVLTESVTDEVEDSKGSARLSPQENTEEDGNEIDLSNILLRLHRPHNVIILETNYGTNLGYLIVSKEDVPQSINLTQSLSTLVGKITTVTGKDTISSENITDRLVRFIIKNCLDKAKAKNNLKTNVKNIDQLLKGLDPNIYKYVKRLFVEQDIVSKGQYNRLKVRFIPSSRMIPYSISSAEYDPYGESFVDPLVFPCKLYIISQLSNVITKLSRAAPVRKWTIDSGASQMSAGLIQKLKRELYNTRITLDDLSSFKNIPKLLSDFKDNRYMSPFISNDN